MHKLIFIIFKNYKKFDLFLSLINNHYTIKIKMEFINEIEHNNDKYFLKKELDEWLFLDENKKSKLLVKKELEKKVPLFKKNKEYYRNLIFYSKSENVVDELVLEIIFCNNNYQGRYAFMGSCTKPHGSSGYYYCFYCYFNILSYHYY